MKNLICVAFMIFTALAFSQDASDKKVKAPKIISKLKLNTAYKAKNIEVKLVEVVSDSRCPKGVNCMWAGEAVVLVDVYKDGEKLESKKITFDSKGDKTIFSSDTISIIGHSVMPYPEANSKIEPEAYYLQLEVKDL